jgi:transcriptional regulator with XRE-family HTH domain
MPSYSDVYDAISAKNQMRLRELGERLRLARQRRQWTQKILSQKTGMSEGTIKKMEAGNPRVPLGFWVQLLDVFALADELELLAQP